MNHNAPLPYSRTDLYLVLFLFGGLSLTFAGHGTFVDENLIIQTVDSFARHGELTVSNMHQALQGPDGEFYSRYGFGFPLVMLPFFYLGDILHFLFPDSQAFFSNPNFFALLWGNLLITVLTGWVMYRLCLEYGASKSISVFMAISLIFGTSFWPYAQTLFRLTAAGCTLIITLWLVKLHEKIHLKRYLTGIIFIAALGLNIREDLAIAFTAIGIFALIQGTWTERGHRFWAFFAGGMLGFFLWGLHNYIRFDAFFVENYADLSFTQPWIESLPELIWGAHRGLVTYSPLCLLLPLSFKACKRNHTLDIWTLCVFILCAYFLLYGKSKMWYGGMCWGPRYMYFLLPFALLPSIWLWKEQKWTKWFAMPAFLWGMSFNWPGVYAHQGKYQSFFSHPPFFQFLTQPVVHPDYITFDELDLWWIRMIKLHEGWGWPLAFSLLLLFTVYIGYRLWGSLRSTNTNQESAAQ